MSNSNILNINGITPRWEFVNLFNDVAKSLYYCRLRLFVPGMNRNDQEQITASGATMQIAFYNANKEARDWKPT